MTVHNAPLIIMISGWAGSGKDSAAALLVEEFGFHRYAFADIIKSSCSAQYNIPLEYFHDVSLKDMPLPEWPDKTTPRDLLIAYGANARVINKDVFVHNTVMAIQNDGHQHVVITDWRFPNEVKYMKEAYFASPVVTVRIQRPDLTSMDSPSEHQLDDAPTDLTIVNDGSISDLRSKIREAVSPYMETLFQDVE